MSRRNRSSQKDSPTIHGKTMKNNKAHHKTSNTRPRNTSRHSRRSQSNVWNNFCLLFTCLFFYLLGCTVVGFVVGFLIDGLFWAWITAFFTFGFGWLTLFCRQAHVRKRRNRRKVADSSCNRAAPQPNHLMLVRTQ